MNELEQYVSLFAPRSEYTVEGEAALPLTRDCHFSKILLKAHVWWKKLSKSEHT